MSLLDQAMDEPWKIQLELRRLASLPYTAAYLRVHGVDIGPGWRIYGTPLVQRRRGSTIAIGRALHMRNWFSSNPLGVQHTSILATRADGAFIRIGDHVSMTGAVICAQSGITIGDRVRIGANSAIVDTDFHPLDARERISAPREGSSRPVVIEEDVFLGTRVLVMKGSTIGRGSIIGAGSVVVGEIPAGSIAAGNPARVIRALG